MLGGDSPFGCGGRRREARWQSTQSRRRRREEEQQRREQAEAELQRLRAEFERSSGDRRTYQDPVFSIDRHGSAGSSAAPFWRSSMEMPSGLLTKAMRPSRGGRLMVTPLSMSL